MRKLQLLTITALLATSLLTACGNLSPRKSEEALRANLLEEVPLGSSVDQVRALVLREQWKVEADDMQSGFFDQRPRPPVVTGAKHIEAYLGEYQGIPWEADVSVYWGFDESGKLIDIWVWKTWNTL